MNYIGLIKKSNLKYVCCCIPLGKTATKNRNCNVSQCSLFPRDMTTEHEIARNCSADVTLEETSCKMFVNSDKVAIAST